jgi:hypothetical protein
MTIRRTYDVYVLGEGSSGADQWGRLVRSAISRHHLRQEVDRLLGMGYDRDATIEIMRNPTKRIAEGRERRIHEGRLVQRSFLEEQ